MNDVLTFIIYRVNYFIYIILMMLGMYGIFVKKNYMKKIIGLNILQTAIILFFISIGAKRDATIPILEHHNDHGAHAIVQAIDYINPLPHVLMLTAIVVAVATLGVALAMAIKIYKDFGTIEEDKILFQMAEESDTEIKNEKG
ncbi:MAG: cation:proton antiporter subunit C [Pseudomonadota bacterium]|nr:cation:proton antiporter subunit C [Pseudomonadota bacterium]